MSFYRYACEFYNQKGELDYVRSIAPMSRDEVNAHGIFTYRLYTSESETEGAHSLYVVSLGYEKRDPKRDLIHSRPYNRYALHYFISGRGYYGDEPLHAGTFLFVPPYMERIFTSDPNDPLEFYYVTVAGVGSEAIINDAGLGHEVSLTDCPFANKLSNIFDPLLFEPMGDSDPTMHLVGAFYQLMALHKYYSVSREDLPQDKAFFYYKQALAYIEVYLLDGTTPADIAKYLHISQPYLRKIFARYGKYPLREYLLRKKIKHAANMLAYSQCTVATAASTIGYEDYTQFTKLFKKYMGVSPRVYKDAHKSDGVEERV